MLSLGLGVGTGSIEHVPSEGLGPMVELDATSCMLLDATILQ